MALFAGYGFNKSHSAAYSVVAYQTMYFKANYTAEYMASVLSHNMSDIKKVSFFIEECQRLDIPVDPPNINTAEGKFVVRETDVFSTGCRLLKVWEATQLNRSQKSE